LLTLISGFIPSRIAANKDPVISLRSESWRRKLI
jgi:ABC-type antimicrobial peptide transport system permease subunit